MPCSASRRSRSLLRMWRQQVSAPHLEAVGCCVRCWGQGCGASRCGARRCCVRCWGRGAVPRDVEHGIGRREDPADCRRAGRGARGAGRGARGAARGAVLQLRSRGPALTWPRCCLDQGFRPTSAPLVPSAAVACPSGLRSAPRKRVWAQVHPGFESLRHRQGSTAAQSADVCHCTRRLSGNATGASAST